LDGFNKDRASGDERILGSPVFVEAIQRELPTPPTAGRASLSVDAIVQQVCAHLGLSPVSLQSGGRKRTLARAREGIAYLCTEVAGHPGRSLAPLLGIQAVSVYAAARRGLVDRGCWDPLIELIE
jgi:hypothetical protein